LTPDARYRDDQTVDVQEGQERLGLALVPDEEPAEVSEPGHGPFAGSAAAGNGCLLEGRFDERDFRRGTFRLDGVLKLL
jgi:hypothetical protein